ncbi:endonuclease/exonuclease/phosphatase family protein [Pseudonocardia sp. GCM10023141]|uniref:endonuclease/exonuclease/phosphatase family protein n=1 Tax=Pseudonocardia sp. GCM10023141 TaxID=3252653 RepID=UPI00361E4581
MTATVPRTDPPPASPPRRPRRALRFVSAALLTAAAAAGGVPDLLFGLDQHSPFAQLVAYRPVVLVALAGWALLLIGITCFRRRAWPFAAGALAVVLAGAAMILPRTLADPVPTTGSPLTVLSFNVKEGGADVAALAGLIGAEHPDLVSLPEAGERYRARLAPLVERLGYRIRSAVPPGQPDVSGVTVLMAAGLGDLTVREGYDTTRFPHLEVTGGALGSLRFVAFHAAAPVPWLIPQWRSDLGLLARWCAGPTPAIVAGDFNATLDHSALRAGMAGCTDAADQRGAGLEPTWGPNPALSAVGPQIDHVTATGGIAAATFSVHDLPGSDHRAILTRMRLPA